MSGYALLANGSHLDTDVSTADVSEPAKEAVENRDSVLAAPNLFIVPEALLALAVLVCSLYRGYAQASHEPLVLSPPRLLTDDGARMSSGLVVTFFVEVGGFLVAAVRLGATVLAERVAPEHLVFSFGSAFAYGLLGVVRVVGAAKDGADCLLIAKKTSSPVTSTESEESSAVFSPATLKSLRGTRRDSWSLGLLELIAACVSLADGVLRVLASLDMSDDGHGGWHLLTVSSKALLNFPYVLLLPEMVSLI